MRKVVLPTLWVLMAVLLLSSTALASGNINLSGETWDLGYLIANGTLSGVGNTDLVIRLEASGFPVITCTNQGGSQAPGNTSPKLSVTGSQSVSDDDLVDKNGKATFRIEIRDLPGLNAVEAGCPNENWSARIEFIYWTDATLTVLDRTSQAILRTQDYVCVTSSTFVSCTPVP